MSNIYTSYVRIKRKDGLQMTSEEIDYLFRNTVTVHEEFGSYWVRIVKKYREQENCLDIQFGSGKKYSDIFTADVDNINKYHVVERINNEGGHDSIFEFEFKKTFVDRTAYRKCKYAFDRILIESDTNWLESLGAVSTNSSTSLEIKISGEYFNSNSKSFVDLYEDSEFYGPRLGYDVNYQYDYFVLTETENLEFISPTFLADIQKNGFENMPNKSTLTFLYNFRKVLTISKNYDELEISSADYWDNCADEIFRSNW